ncbi:MAG: hypothetical protein HYR76_12045 [Ignavibacteria bacterium]|nr:hypothetical protein [Ignavibacteria bacterium]MBI3766607.1 hypothetical protein [Ignavibacteriales bacterium]
MHLKYFIITIALLTPFQLKPLRLNAQESTTVGGYGELHYNEPNGSTRGTLDFHRFVLYLAHTFNENLSFKSEVEIEHTKIEATEGGGAEGGEVAIEQAYLDWHFNQNIGMKAGILLPPIGVINQFHEPATFNGVERPNVDRIVIPTTWRESGAGIYGTLSEGVKYQLYVMAGLKAEDFSGSEGIREGRQEALESSPMNPSFTGRLEYVPTPELKLGGSFFTGNITEGVDSLGSSMLTLLSGDAQYAYDQFSLRAVGAFISISDAQKINTAYGNDVADQIYGFYLEGSYNILPLMYSESDQALLLFTRYEKYNTQSKVTGFIANPVYDRNEITFGATYKPTYNTAFKIDYQFFNNAANADTKQMNIGVGYNF